MASTYLERTIEAGSVGRTFTYSVWFKRAKTGASTQLWNLSSDDDLSKYIEICIKSDDKLDMQFRNGSSGDNGTYIRRIPTRVFRDTNCFYHVVLRFDSTESSADDRFRLYINGEQETSFSTSTGTIPQNYVTDLANSGGEHRIGRGAGSSSAYWDGEMAHLHFCDGYSYAPTEFGETDTTTGIWKPKVSPSVSYGTNGCFLKFDNSANMGLDSSGQSHNFTVSGTIIQNKDTPSNVFATFNPLDNYYPAMTLSNGNTRALTIGGKYTYIPSTLGMTSGKYYAEIKCTAQSGSQEEFLVGITSTQTTATTHEVGHYGNDYGYNGVAGQYRTSNANTSYGAAYTTGDIIGIAVDLDNNKLYFSKNGVFQNSGVPTSGSTGTGAINITDSSSTVLGAYFFAVCYFSSTNTGTYDANFGNGYFGTTAVSSAQNPDDGNGIFEYDVPAGYRALCTKSLNAEEYS